MTCVSSAAWVVIWLTLVQACGWFQISSVVLVVVKRGLPLLRTNKTLMCKVVFVSSQPHPTKIYYEHIKILKGKSERDRACIHDSWQGGYLLEDYWRKEIALFSYLLDHGPWRITTPNTPGHNHTRVCAKQMKRPWCCNNEINVLIRKHEVCVLAPSQKLTYCLLHPLSQGL